jgi:hypothetical protein
MISNLGLVSESGGQVLFSAETSETLPRKLRNFPVDCISHVFSFLDIYELALAERVSRAWHEMSTQDQTLWKEQCLTQNISVISPHIQQALSNYFSENVKSHMDDKILSLITEYDTEAVGANYKEQASISRGNVMFYPHTWQMHPRPSWQKTYRENSFNPEEPFACIRIFSPITHPQNMAERVFGRCWHENPPNKLKPFSSFLPFRLFINKDGGYKNNGQNVQIFWKGRKVILTCIHQLNSCDSLPINSFKEAANQLVKVSLSRSFITSAALQKAETEATLAGEWIDLN